MKKIIIISDYLTRQRPVTTYGPFTYLWRMYLVGWDTIGMLDHAGVLSRHYCKLPVLRLLPMLLQRKVKETSWYSSVIVSYLRPGCNISEGLQPNNTSEVNYVTSHLIRHGNGDIMCEHYWLLYLVGGKSKLYEKKIIPYFLLPPKIQTRTSILNTLL